MNWTAAAAILLCLAVAFGAFGAHGLKDRLDSYSMGVYEKAVLYHFFHALGLLVLPALLRSDSINSSAAPWIGWLLIAGIVLFSGSLYALAITGNRGLGAVTPFGGVSFIAAWAVLALAAIKK